MREAADAMVSTGLIDHGYMYVNIDDCWMVKPGSKDPLLGGQPRDAQGNVNPNKRFPDMKALTDYIHAKGLKAGLYTSPGPLTCGGACGAYQHEEQDARRFAEWGFDFLKYDWCSYWQYRRIVRPRRPAEALSPDGRILKKLDRDIVFNFANTAWATCGNGAARSGGQSWRIADDFGGDYENPSAMSRYVFDLYGRNELQKYSGPGAWNDPDYILLGYLQTGRAEGRADALTPNEQYTHVSLWCLVAAPLIFSGDITRLDDFTLSLLTTTR